jgi:hypothetical protein
LNKGIVSVDDFVKCADTASSMFLGGGGGGGGRRGMGERDGGNEIINPEELRIFPREFYFQPEFPSERSKKTR